MKIFKVMFLLSTMVVISFYGSSVPELHRVARVHDNPLLVEAVISTHEKHKDGYRAVAIYTVDSNVYEVPFELGPRGENLMPVGMTFTFAVDPENPDKFMKNPKSFLDGLVYAIIFIACGISFLLSEFTKKFLSKGNLADFDVETIKKDAHIKNSTRMCLWASLIALIMSAITIAPCLNLISDFFILSVIFQLGVFVCSLVCFILFYFKIKKGAFIVKKDKLVEKKDDTKTIIVMNFLIYRSDNGKKWGTTVEKSYFNMVKEGTEVTSVYIRDSKRPFIYYDIEGNSHR